MQLTVIGTGHVFRIGPTVAEAIHALRPDVVFVELDRGRLRALQAKARGIESKGRGGFVQKRLAKFQDDMAKQYGGEVGEEMLAAVAAGHQIGARVVLIDDPADQTLKRLLKELTWREKFRGIGQLITGAFRKRSDVETEVKAYQDDPGAALATMAGDYPTVYRVLIQERDQRMSSRIRANLGAEEHGVAVLGDGHVNGMRELLQIPGETYRLPDVREGRLPRVGGLAQGDSSSVSLAFDVPGQGPPPQGQ